MIFDVDHFYDQARSGENIDGEGLLRYIFSFENVILWGAGSLGMAVGRVLKERGVAITRYWDRNAGEIIERNAIPVSTPFSQQYDTDKTLIISCINNGSLSDRWPLGVIKQHGYKHALLGGELQMGMSCPLNEQNCNDLALCMNTQGCYLSNCMRYISLNAKRRKREDRELSFQVLTFILSLRCTLNCKYCGQRLIEIPKEARRNFDKEAIKRDIDHMMEVVDFVGMISLIGGEPFIHPDLLEIVKHILNNWDNFGIIEITTNGVFHVSMETIYRLKHPKVVINFSLYDEFLSKEQKAIQNQNLEAIKNAGIAYKASHPTWVKTQQNLPHQYSEDYMECRKKDCASTWMCPAVQNGVFVPCSVAHNIINIEQYDISEDLVDVTKKEGLRQRLLENQDKRFYRSCIYCSDKAAPQVPAGEQA